MKLFREWLREKETEQITEIFGYISDYIEVSKDDYLEYERKILEYRDPEYLKKINLESDKKRNHGPRVHYYLYKDFLIFYGKFKSSNKYEVHFWNIKELSFEALGGEHNYSTVFSAIMSIIKDKHISKGKSDNVYIKHKNKLKVEFYQRIIQTMLKKYELNNQWFIHFDKRGLYISKDEHIMTEREFMVIKQIISQETKELLDRLDENNKF